MKNELMKFDEKADIFKTLSDSNRLKILSIINNDGEVCTCKLLEHLKITQPTLVYHMKMMMDVQLVTCYKRGTWCVYKINYDQFRNIEKFLKDFNVEKK